jgi:hypothetical protein
MVTQINGSWSVVVELIIKKREKGEGKKRGKERGKREEKKKEKGRKKGRRKEKSVTEETYFYNYVTPY